jgi:hypothetical protein
MIHRSHLTNFSEIGYTTPIREDDLSFQEGKDMKAIRGIIASFVSVIRDTFDYKSDQIQMQRTAIHSKKHHNLYTRMDRGREVF